MESLETRLAPLSSEARVAARKLISIAELPTHAELRELMQSARLKIDLPKFCLDYGLFQLFTKEFVDELATYMQNVHAQEDVERPILEVCAGGGKLAYQLNKRGVPVNPTDSYEFTRWDSRYVEQKNHVQALKKYKPQIVLASWIPHESKLGLDVLRFPSVRHFITIGEGHGESCSDKGVYDLARPEYCDDISQYSVSFIDPALFVLEMKSKSVVEHFRCADVKKDPPQPFP